VVPTMERKPIVEAPRPTGKVITFRPKGHATQSPRGSFRRRAPGR
jgi:hypothetical protein